MISNPNLIYMQPKINLKLLLILLEFTKSILITNQLIKTYNHIHDFIIDPTNRAITIIY